MSKVNKHCPNRQCCWVEEEGRSRGRSSLLRRLQLVQMVADPKEHGCACPSLTHVVTLGSLSGLVSMCGGCEPCPLHLGGFQSRERWPP